MLVCELFEFMVYGLQGQKYSVDLSIMFLFGEADLCVEVIIVKQFFDILGQCIYFLVSQYDLFVRDDKTVDGNVFVKGENNLVIVRVSANFDYVAFVQYEILIKKYIIAFKIGVDEIIYKDFFIRNELSDVIVVILIGKYKFFEDVVFFDMGTFFDRNDVQVLYIVVYFKYYIGGEYDFACRVNFIFRFVGDDGIVGEGIYIVDDIFQNWLGDINYYDL